VDGDADPPGTLGLVSAQPHGHCAEDSQRYVEREFMDRRYVSSVSRDHLGNDRGFDSDGWVTIIDLNGDDGDDGDDRDDGGPPVHLAMLGLLPGVMLIGHVTSRTEPRALVSPRVRHAFVLAGALIGLYLFVRFGAIAVEARLGDLDPRFVAGAFYPLLVVGLPVCTYYFARPLDRPTAFAAGSVGFATAILLDYTALGVTRLPVTVFVHRFSTAIALGFIAVGASHAERIDPEDHGFVRMGRSSGASRYSCRCSDFCSGRASADRPRNRRGSRTDASTRPSPACSRRHPRR